MKTLQQALIELRNSLDTAFKLRNLQDITLNYFYIEPENGMGIETEIANAMIGFSEYWFGLPNIAQVDYLKAFPQLSKLFIPLQMKPLPDELMHDGLRSRTGQMFRSRACEESALAIADELLENHKNEKLFTQEFQITIDRSAAPVEHEFMLPFAPNSTLGNLEQFFLNQKVEMSRVYTQEEMDASIHRARAGFYSIFDESVFSEQEEHVSAAAVSYTPHLSTAAQSDERLLFGNPNPWVSPINHSGDEYIEREINQTVAELRDYGVTKSLIIQHWQPNHSTDAWDGSAKAALIFLIKGIPPVVGLREPRINPLPENLRLQPIVALQEISRLNDHGMDALFTLYGDGLRGNHLRTLPGNFDLYHKWALIALVKYQHLSVEQALEQITGVSEAAAMDIYHSTQRASPAVLIRRQISPPPPAMSSILEHNVFLGPHGFFQPNVSPINHIGSEHIKRRIDETVAELRDYGVTQDLIIQHWQPHHHTIDAWDVSAKEALIFLIKGIPPSVLVGEAPINPLPENLRLQPIAALQELSQLNNDGRETLYKLYEHGLRGNHLRALHGNFELSHKVALIALVKEQHVPIDQALQRIKGITEDVALDISRSIQRAVYS